MYRSKKFPEIELFFGYLPAEYERGFIVNPADVEFHYLEINGDRVSEDLEQHLFEQFGDDWECEIIDSSKRMSV
jgi:hypothetical protein